MILVLLWDGGVLAALGTETYSVLEWSERKRELSLLRAVDKKDFLRELDLLRVELPVLAVSFDIAIEINLELNSFC